MKIKPIKNPYIPKEYDGSQQCCSKKADPDFKNWLIKYTDIDLQDASLIRDDITGAYTPQGGCVYNNEFIFRALVKEDEEPAIVQKIRISDGKVIKEVNDRAYGHANDMFIKNDKLYILHSSSTNIVYELSLDLEYIQTIATGPTRWGQAYNSVDGVDVVGPVGSAYLSNYIDGSFLYRNKPDNAFSGLVRQGIFCDENYIGVVCDNTYGAEGEEIRGSRIMFYTWNGMFIKSVYIPIAEIEWADYVRSENLLYFGTYDGRDPNDTKSGKIYKIEFDLYPGQTVLTGRPTDVSGGLNNMHRLPEGTPIKLWEGTQSEGTITLQTKNTRLQVDEDGPFRYLIFEFDGANAQTFVWFPKNNGVVALRETDVTAAANDSTIRNRETRLVFDNKNQAFNIDSCIIEEIKFDQSEDKITITKNPEGIECNKIRSIWGVI